jgi:hypothetical protein
VKEADSRIRHKGTSKQSSNSNYQQRTPSQRDVLEDEIGLRFKEFANFAEMKKGKELLVGTSKCNRKR